MLCRDLNGWDGREIQEGGDVCVLVAQSCQTLWEPIDWGSPGFSIHGILQARILEWVAIPFSRGFSQPRSPRLQADSLPAEPQGKPKNTGVGSLSLLQWIFPIQELKSSLLCWRRKWQPTPVFLPGESHGWRSLVGCSPWGRTESDTTEAT